MKAYYRLLPFEAAPVEFFDADLVLTFVRPAGPHGGEEWYTDRRSGVPLFADPGDGPAVALDLPGELLDRCRLPPETVADFLVPAAAVNLLAGTSL